MSEIPANAVKKIQKLVQIAADLCNGKDYNITRLTMLKSLCSDPEAAANFAVHLAKLTQKKMKGKSCPDYIEAENWRRYQRLAASAVRRMTEYLKKRTSEAETLLWKLHSELRDAQNQYEKQRWALVRIVESMELVIVETALECILHPWASSDLGYRIARKYAERYDSRYGTGLLPKSAPMVEDIAEFWGQHFLGRGWRKRLAK